MSAKKARRRGGRGFVVSVHKLRGVIQPRVLKVGPEQDERGCSHWEGERVREVERIADQARKMFAGGAWHGPSVVEVLADVDANGAASHPIPGAHSIWELVLHLIATQAVLQRRIRGETAGLKVEDFWPALPPASEAAWAETIERLKKQEADLHQAVTTFPEERLDTRLTAEGSSAYNNFHGYVQHNAYHAGQISLLKKASRARQSPADSLST